MIKIDKLKVKCFEAEISNNKEGIGLLEDKINNFLTTNKVSEIIKIQHSAYIRSNGNNHYICLMLYK